MMEGWLYLLYRPVEPVLQHMVPAVLTGATVPGVITDSLFSLVAGGCLLARKCINRLGGWGPQTVAGGGGGVMWRASLSRGGDRRLGWRPCVPSHLRGMGAN